MLDFQPKYDALRGEFAKLGSRAFRDSTRTVLEGWPYWVPVTILAAVAGHLV